MCQLTGFAADFEGNCKDYKLDGTVTDTIKIRTKDRPFVPLFDPVPDPEVIEARKKAVQKKAGPYKAGAKKANQKKKPSLVALTKVRRYQSFLYALIGGLLITAAASAGWAFIAALSGFRRKQHPVL